MPDLVFTTRGAAQIIAEQERIAESLGKQKTAAAQLNAEYRANEAELKKLNRTAQQLSRDTETAQERYNRKLKEAKAALQGSANETEQLKRVTTQLRVELLAAVDSNKKLTDAEKHKIDVKRRYREQLQQEISALPKLTSETHRLMGEYTQTGAALDTLIRKKKSLFSQESVENFSAFAGKISAVLAPLAAFSSAIEEGNNILRGYGGKAISAAKSAGGLSQLAGGDPAKLQALVEASKQSFREGGFETLDEANRLTFELESGGILRDRPFLSKLQAASVDDAAQVAKSTSLVAAAFGRKEAGYTEQLVSKGLAAAGPAPGANLGDIMQGVAASAAAAKPLGLSDEEVFALVSRIAEVTGSGTEAGTRAEALFRSLARQGFADDPRAAINAKLGKSDTKLAALRSRLSKEQGFAEKNKGKRASEYAAAEAKRKAAFDKREQERIAGIQEELADARLSLKRGQEDFRESDSAYGRRGAQRRIDDAKTRIARLEGELKPKSYVPGEAPESDDSKTILNIQNQIAAEQANRDKLAAQLAATGPRAKMSLSQMLDKVGRQGLEQSGLIKYLGRQEAAQAFDIAKDVPAFQQRLAEIEEAQRTGLATRVVDSAATIPGVATRRQTLAAKAEAQLELEAKSLQRERIDAEWEKTRARVQNQYGKVPAWMTEKIMQGGSIGPVPLPGFMSFVPDALEDPGIRDPNERSQMEIWAEQIDAQKQQQATAEAQLKVQERLLEAFSTLPMKLDSGMISE